MNVQENYLAQSQIEYAVNNIQKMYLVHYIIQKAKIIIVPYFLRCPYQHCLTIFFIVNFVFKYFEIEGTRKIE